MDMTLILTGMLPFIVLVSAGLTAAASFFLLWLYRRAVLRSMGTQAAVSACPPTPRIKADQRSASDIPPVIPVKSTNEYDSADTSESSYLRTVHSLRKVTILYTTGGLAYAVILALPWMLFADGGFVLIRFLWLVLCYIVGLS